MPGILSTITNTFCEFGIVQVTLSEAIDLLQSRFPMQLHLENFIWQCIPDDMNPHSSRTYRSTSEVLTVGPNDIGSVSFVVTETPYSSIENSVIFNYSHGYPDRGPGANVAYVNQLSKMYFGERDQLVIDEPIVHQSNYESAAVSAATVMAQWYGRRQARPRLIVKVRLTQKFYDLKRGHTLEFAGLESVGIECPAFRCGLLDYYHFSASSSNNYADNLFALFVAASGTSELYIGVSQQTDRITFPVSTAAGYTTVSNGWEYSNTSGGWTALTGVVNADALKTTGIQTVSWTRPRFDLHEKREITFAGLVSGPCYWYRMKYSTATAQGLGANARITYPAVWAGRIFEVIETRRGPFRSSSDYPALEAVFMEMM